MTDEMAQRSSRWRPVMAGMLVLAALVPGRGADLPARVDFNRHIRPLLSDKCFRCHGPDERARKGKLRLDRKEEVYQAREKGVRVLVPGQPEQSELIRRITAENPEDRMPPAETKNPLSAEEVALIRRWIEQGAEYKSHWAFLPIEATSVPWSAEEVSVKGERRTAPWARNALDVFIQDRLRREGLAPSVEAERETLIRRVTMDLTGLPPVVAQIDDFLGDRSSGAYERVVDRLLQSPAYGERMATDWMDLARYADTYGYQADVDRDLSPWRDWVIAALNRNLPYDQFLIWQIAGDLLEEPTVEQRLATAFNRLHRQTNEGGSIEEEFRTEYVADRVHTLGTAILGLTLECARCHDHKYDPVTQSDYYRMFAFFNSIDESGLYSHFTQAVPTPGLLLYGPGLETRHRELRSRIAQAEKGLEAARIEARPRFELWRRSHSSGLTNLPQPSAFFAFEEVADNKTPDGIGTNQPAILSDGPAQVSGRVGKALKFSGDNELVCKGSGQFRRTDAFSFSLWLRRTEPQPRAVVFHRSRSWTDSGSRGYELLLEEGRLAFELVHFWPGNALGVRARSPLPNDQWTHVGVTYDGSSSARGVALYVNGKPVETEVVRDHLYKDILHRAEWGDADVGNIHLTLAGRFRDSGFKNGEIDEFRVYDQCLTAAEVQVLAGAGAGETDSGEGDDWFEAYLRDHDEAWKRARAELQAEREAERKLLDDVPEIMVMQELPVPRETHRLKRGVYNAPAEAVEPGTPESILPFPQGAPRNRLGLARWLVDSRNPLTSRVLVNRIWKLHFGRGLVGTVEDFGSQGQGPTHPELLDWLAAWFQKNGWDRKALHRLIVTSATYRQSSRAGAELLARDPENRLLARGPKHRLAAEQIRDEALASSGLLSGRMGGPSVKPYQPAGLWEESGTGKTYQSSKGEGLYRRSLYTFWRRTSPPPTMLTFDATSREVCTAKRDVTATPLQSLVLLNDPQFVEAARVLAETLMMSSGEGGTGWIEEGFRRVLGRSPQPREKQILETLYHEQLGAFAREPGAAEKYLKTGDSASRGRAEPAALAAGTVVLNALMNHDEFVMKR